MVTVSGEIGIDIANFAVFGDRNDRCGAYLAAASGHGPSSLAGKFLQA